MTDYPILFQSEMVLATLAGVKTETGRILKLPSWSTGNWNDFELDVNGRPMVICANTGCLAEIKSPYGYAGDRLWVRETWRTLQGFNAVSPKDLPVNFPVQYKADKTIFGTIMGPFGKWRPSIFMPRRAGRLLLKVNGIRAERLQEIGKEDYFLEGWDTNPWVWVVEYELVEYL